MDIRPDLDGVLLWGTFATSVLTLVMSASQEFGWSRISLPYMMGTIFSSRRSHAVVIGFALQFLLGALIAFGYALLFEGWQRATWWIGALLGLHHALLVLVVGMPVLASIHPRMASKHHGPTPTRQLEPPGFFALNYGRRTPIVTVVAHVLYGLILGAFYQVG